MMKMFFELSMLTFEAQQAMWLRALKLSSGGAAGDREARLMVTEKMAAAQRATIGLLLGAAPVAVVRGYRRKVRANVRRLSRKKTIK